MIGDIIRVLSGRNKQCRTVLFFETKRQEHFQLFRFCNIKFQSLVLIQSKILWSAKLKIERYTMFKTKQNKSYLQETGNSPVHLKSSNNKS